MMRQLVDSEGGAVLSPWLVRMVTYFAFVCMIGWATWSTVEHFMSRAEIADAKAQTVIVSEKEEGHYAILSAKLDAINAKLGESPPVDPRVLGRIESKIDQINSAQDALARRQQSLERASR